MQLDELSLADEHQPSRHAEASPLKFDESNPATDRPYQPQHQMKT